MISANVLSRHGNYMGQSRGNAIGLLSAARFNRFLVYYLLE